MKNFAKYSLLLIIALSTLGSFAFGMEQGEKPQGREAQVKRKLSEDDGNPGQAKKTQIEEPVCPICLAELSAKCETQMPNSFTITNQIPPVITTSCNHSYLYAMHP